MSAAQRVLWGTLATAAIGACSSAAPAPATEPVDPLALTPIVDRNPDPNVVEVDLEAKETQKQFGRTPVSKVWSYNGTVPGPIIEAKVGDRLIVHFRNALPESTTVHWHGIRLPAAMDGSPAMQRPVEPGGTFTYDFVLKDAGLFWFHPHMRTDLQVEKGLAGVIRVRGAEEPSADEERVLVLDDVRLKDDGTFPTYLDDTSKMMGRQGNTLLVNGTVDATITVRPGAAVRWRILNVANGRFFNLRIPGVQWRVLGTDGGHFAKPYDADHLLIAPAERYDVMFIAPGAGTVDLVGDPYDRGHDSGKDAPVVVARVRVAGAAVASPKPLPTAFAATARRPDGPADIPLALDESTNAAGELAFTVNGAVYPNVPTVMVPRNAARILEVKNLSEMDHPFHLHGFFFQVLSTNGVPTADDRIVPKDTVIVPMKSTLKLAAVFDEPGMWMYHCHINEHAEGGMMGEIHVE